MEPNRHTELAAEIAELQHQQLESFAEATFAGWTPEQNTAHNERADRMEALQRVLDRHERRPLSEFNTAAR